MSPPPPAPTHPAAPRHLLEVDDLSADELAHVLALAAAPPAPADAQPPPVLAGKGMALLFQKPSARTRHSMEMAVVQLGGHPVTVAAAEVSIDQREPAEDLARTLGCYHAAIGARVGPHSLLERMAEVSPVPVVNMLSDTAHPLQALADLLTMQQIFGDLRGLQVAFVGDANNVARSLAIGTALSGARFNIASPQDYGFAEADVARINAAGSAPTTFHDPADAVVDAHVVYTDVWTSMGQESDADARRQAFAGYTVDEQLMSLAAPDAVFLHCLPAHEGEEVTAGVLHGPQSRIWQQAQNRMHAARGLLQWLLQEAP